MLTHVILICMFCTATHALIDTSITCTVSNNTMTISLDEETEGSMTASDGTLTITSFGGDTSALDITNNSESSWLDEKLMELPIDSDCQVGDTLRECFCKELKCFCSAVPSTAPKLAVDVNPKKNQHADKWWILGGVLAFLTVVAIIMECGNRYNNTEKDRSPSTTPFLSTNTDDKERDDEQRASLDLHVSKLIF